MRHCVRLAKDDDEQVPCLSAQQSQSDTFFGFDSAHQGAQRLDMPARVRIGFLEIGESPVLHFGKQGLRIHKRLVHGCTHGRVESGDHKAVYAIGRISRRGPPKPDAPSVRKTLPDSRWPVPPGAGRPRKSGSIGTSGLISVKSKTPCRPGLTPVIHEVHAGNVAEGIVLCRRPYPPRERSEVRWGSRPSAIHFSVSVGFQAVQSYEQKTIHGPIVADHGLATIVPVSYDTCCRCNL